MVAILRELGAPPRLTRLLEGESLLNDAAAIVLFTRAGRNAGERRRAASRRRDRAFRQSFLGGILLGVVGGRLFGAILPLLGGSRMAEVTLSVALPYIVYLVGEEVFEVSGVVAVVSAGLIAGAVARVAPSAGQLALSRAGVGADRLLGRLADLHHRVDPGAATARRDRIPAISGCC